MAACDGEKLGLEKLLEITVFLVRISSLERVWHTRLVL